MANQIYFGIVREAGEDVFELHVSHNAQDVINTDALSKRVPCTKEHWTKTIPAWRKEMKDRFGAIEIFSFKKEVTI